MQEGGHSYTSLFKAYKSIHLYSALTTKVNFQSFQILNCRCINQFSRTSFINDVYTCLPERGILVCPAVKSPFSHRPTLTNLGQDNHWVCPAHTCHVTLTSV